MERILKEVQQAVTGGLKNFIVMDVNMVLTLILVEIGQITTSMVTMTALMSLNWKRRLGKKSGFSERLLWYPTLSDFDDYRVESDAKFDFTIGKNLFWTLAVSNRFDNSPLAGKEKNDITITTAITQKF